MSYKLVYNSKRVTRFDLENSFSIILENGEQLVAIVPYSTTDNVTVITMKRVPIDPVTPEPINLTELNVDGVTANATVN